MIGCTIAVCLVLAGLFVPPIQITRISNADCLFAYDFEEASITKAQDLTDFNIDGIYQGNVVYEHTLTKWDNYSRYFDGTGDYITLDGTKTDLAGYDELTVIFWVYIPNTLPVGLIHKTTDDSYRLMIWLNKLYALIKNSLGAGAGYYVSTDLTPYINKWTMVGFRYNGSYIEGIINGQLTGVGGVQTGTIKGSTATLELCRYTATYEFQGYMDNVQLFRTALDENHLNIIYHHGIDLLIKSTTVLWYWYFALTPVNVGLFFAVVVSITLILLVVHRGIKKVTRR